MSRELTLEEALDIAMEMELKAQAFYAQAAVEVQDPRGRDLLGRLAAFEQYHYHKLSELAGSLYDSGRYIDYAARAITEFAPLAGSGETSGTRLSELGDQASILGKAIDNEKLAGEHYRALADTTTDPAGRSMFQSLASEERTHQRVLEDEFYSLSNKGTWAWSEMYGE